MAIGKKRGAQASGEGPPRDEADAFATSLTHRRRAAQGLERDLIMEVPLLYGSADGVDPGISLQRLHGDELVRRNGGGRLPGAGRRSENALPFEGATTLLAVLLALLFLFLK